MPRECQLLVSHASGSYGWLSKSWSPFGSPKYSVPHYTKEPKMTIILTTTHMFIGRSEVAVSLKDLRLIPSATPTLQQRKRRMHSVAPCPKTSYPHGFPN